jgi:hydroxymethylglutaryl-CoA reductase (NADPH)
VEDTLGVSIKAVKGDAPDPDPVSLRGTVEQQIGWARIPLGLAGPLRVMGSAFVDEVCLPLATSEGALVASIDRGARALTLSGGVCSICLSSGIQRAPSFLFQDIHEALRFLAWVDIHSKELEESIHSVSRHSVLQEIRPNLDGNLVTLILEFTTGDAAGQNMVTVCADAICRYLSAHCPVRPRRWFIEGNLSGDKRATTLSLQRVRGHKVVAEAVLPASVLHGVLGTDQERMMDYWKVAAINGIHSGSVGVQGHFANPLAALFCACGQDIACVAEAAVGVTRFEERPDGALYASVTLPSLVVGTVGGGTRLPTAQESLAILGCAGEGKVVRFAEICAGAVLAGELSMLAALSSGDFARAHALFGRKVR